MAAIPWGPIITVLPSLIDAAGRLLHRADTPPKLLPEVPNQNSQEQLEAVIKRLEYFEALETDQAKLLKQTLEQLQNITLSSSVTARRANIAILIALVSIVLAIAVFTFGILS